MMIIRPLFAPLILGGGYFVAAAAAVLLTRFEGGVAFIWLATSILIADLMTRPRHKWLYSIVPCAIASFLVTGWWGLGWAVASPLAAINMIEAVTAAWLFRRLADPRFALGSIAWLLDFVLAVGLVAPLVAGSLASLVLWSIGLSPLQTFGTFFTGHALGNLTLTPMALLLTRGNRAALLQDLNRRKASEAIVLMMMVVASIWLVFRQDELPLLFLPTLPMILVAFRVGRGGVALSIVLLALFGGVATVSGYGPIQLIGAPFGWQMQFFQFYLAATVLTLLPVAADLENRTRLHRKLHESEAGYRMLAEYSSDIILSLKVDGTIRYISPSCRQLGYDPTHLKGRNCASLIAPEHLAEASEAHLRSLEMGGMTNRFEYLAMTATGEKRWHETHARLIVDDQGNANGILSIVRDIHQQKSNELALVAAAMIDPLTGLGNRRAFRQEVQRRRPQASEAAGCIAVLDIDHFKSVNDRFGHDVGDLVLRGFADVAKRIVREKDVIARIGGEEFAIYFPGTGIEQTLQICDRLRCELNGTMFNAGARMIGITVSGGVSQLGDEGLDHAVKIADQALYRAKQAGRDQLALAA